MELLYKIEGYVSSDNANAVIERVRRMQSANIPVTAGPVSQLPTTKVAGLNKE